MRKKLLYFGFIFSLSFSAIALSSNVAQAKQAKFKPCKVTKKSGSSMYVAATDKDVSLRRGTVLQIVDATLHQGIIVVKTKMNKKWVKGEIKYEDTNCAVLLPQ